MKKEAERKAEVLDLLKKQKIRNVKDIESYKLSVCHPASAGIDLGSRSNYVAINPEIAAEMDVPVVTEFSTMTSGHEACRDFLLSCGVKTVSMESTSVYWMNLYYTLTEAGIEVFLVNPRKFRMVPGRKTDVLDCQWLQTLHMYGLLSGSLIPEDRIRQLRSYMRQRDSLLKDRNRYVQRMQKALIQMNLMLPNVVDDITGKTGDAIVSAIISGERDPKTLASMRDYRCKHPVEDIEAALTGCYKDDQLYLLKINHDAYAFFTSQIAEIDKQIGAILKTFPLKADAGATVKKHKQESRKNSIRAGYKLDDMLLRICGVDLTTITGLQANTILQIISEVGLDMGKFRSAKAFTAYLSFAPRNKITGGVVVSSKTDRVRSSASQAFKKVIPSISQGKSAYAAFYRRVAAHSGTGKAIVATCRKLATTFYNVLKYGTEFVEEGDKRYKERLAVKERNTLIKLAKKHNLTLVPAIAS